MSTDQSDLAASRSPPGSEALQGAASPYTQGAAPSTGPTEQPHCSPPPQLAENGHQSPQSCSENGQHTPSSMLSQQLRKQHHEQRQSPPHSSPSSAHLAESAPTPMENWTPPQVSPRDIVRIFQCQQCSNPYRNAVTLSCGRSICKTCLPETHARTSITYPALPDRVQAFQCPFPACNKEHVLDDCGLDVILNKVAKVVEGTLEAYTVDAVQLRQSTGIVFDATHRDSDGHQKQAKTIRGTKLVATWALAVEGGLRFDAEITYQELPPSSPGKMHDEQDVRVLDKMQQAMRTEMDCQVCYALFYDPLTTGCGHTFCRPCLHRILDHSRYCPICRRKLAINPLLKRNICPSNDRITNIIETFWRDELEVREEAVAAERAARHQGLEVPLFVCTLSFPMMPTFLHIFEPRYRLMIRRALEGDRTFGMVLPKRPRHSGDTPFHELGTLLRIVNAQFYPDGRSLIETVGLSRFRVLQHGQLDGYTVGRTERVDDVSWEEEEAVEAAEVGYDNGVGSDEEGNHRSVPLRQRMNIRTRSYSSLSGGTPFSPPQIGDDSPQTAADLDTLTTRSLMQFAIGFVTRMRDQSVPWLTERMLAIYGECPDDPAAFPWWFASTLPVKDLEKYKLLGTSSVRDRLKICCAWILEMERVRWSLHGCTIL
ncbi:hypothetical protein HIM_07443 [Hirsutella minnesotensis 3608]|uniref:RING-type domain-containing protein n=1 Tax=Hirsutella minnesotensis 3608 TaxID=1043627 RepID=A0A0F7ZHY5_9HYPO|nr:hypothetical protein HIM_07443 [Hirsutella minnesotensis 3608]